MPATLRSAARLLLLGAVIGACEATAPPPPPPAPAAPAPVEPVAAPPPATAAAEPPPPAYPQPPPPDPPIALHGGGKRSVRGDAGVVTSVEPNATHIGAEVLRHGGNAVDAAVAVAFALAVTHPSAGNIGGGGFMMVRLPGGETHAIDFRESAARRGHAREEPGDARHGRPRLRVRGRARHGGGHHARAREVRIAPARRDRRPRDRSREEGPPARPARRRSCSRGRGRSSSATRRRARSGATPASPARRATWSSQPDLARTLEAIAKEGKKGFYEGWVAAAIDKAMRAHGGYVSAADLAGYEARVRDPLRFSYRGFTVETMPPPSMGGVALAEIMLTLERARAWEVRADSGAAYHLFVEAARRAYAERRLVGADPDFLPEPDKGKALLTRLLGGEHLATRRPPIDPDHATPSSDARRGGGRRPRARVAGDDALLGGRRAGHGRLVHVHALGGVRIQGDDPGHGRGARQRDGRLLGERGQRARAGQAHGELDVAHRRQPRRQARAGARVAGRRHHPEHRGAGAPQRRRLGDDDRPGGDPPAHPPRVPPRPRPRGAGEPALGRGPRRSPSGAGTRSRGTPPRSATRTTSSWTKAAWRGARPTSARAGRPRAWRSADGP